ncbi:MAG TPA: imidazoleglycerol-phosphate dehydratase HisB [bacterium]|nr:imidazoleglycerol-phosphate dehydratase HisB [bacterium]
MSPAPRNDGPRVSEDAAAGPGGRAGRASRATGETKVEARWDLDGAGRADTATGVPFLDHMLEQIARHGRFDLSVAASGDLEVDAHHTVEDVGIALGRAFKEAVGAGAGIFRYASAHAPLDEALVLAVVDVSGRPYLHYAVPVTRQRLGAYDTDLTEEFFRAFAVNAGITLHMMLLHGRNGHHIIEAAFKALALALDRATQRDPRVAGVPSTKGTLA